MLDRRETKDDHRDPCIAQVTAIREVADASPLPRRGPTLPLFACVLRAQSTNASLTGRVTDLSKATVAEAKVAAMNTGTNFSLRRAGPIRHGAASRQHRVVQAMDRAVEAPGPSGNGRAGRAVRASAASAGTTCCFGKSADRTPRLLGSVWA